MTSMKYHCGKHTGKPAVIGGGVIGIEFASFFSSVGSMTVIEMMPEIVPLMEPEVSKLLRRDEVRQFQAGLPGGCDYR